MSVRVGEARLQTKAGNMNSTQALEQHSTVNAEGGMRLEFSDSQKQARQEFRSFATSKVAPFAGEWDRQGRLPKEIIQELRQRCYLGAPLPRQVGGQGMDAISYGLLTEELGRGCSAVRTVLTVHDMVAVAVWRWGNRRLKQEVVPRMTSGELLCALALSEPGVGSDAKSVQTEARLQAGHYLLNGRKKWISFGQIADLFLVFARCEGQLAAFLVPADASGFSRQPIQGLLGSRATMLAELSFEECRIPEDHLVGRVGFGLSHIGATALEQGRYSVAWGSVGIAQACLDASSDYTARREQFGRPVGEHQLVRRMMTEMIVNTRAARLLCCRAGWLRQNGDPGAAMETMVAKYYASRTARQAAADAVQLHGANGVTDDYPVARYLRDATVMEIIEGSTQIQQISIAKYPPAEL